MPTLIPVPSRVTAAGNKPKLIDEFVGRVNNGEARLSIARMQAPSGWQEPGQRPEFDEYTLVLEGALLVESADARLEVKAGQAVLTRAGEWCATAPREPRARLTSRSACPHSLQIPFTVMLDLPEHLARRRGRS